METTKKVKRRPKMRYTVLRNMITDARDKVITADLELSFLTEMKKKNPNFQPLRGTYEQSIAELKMVYDYYMLRLTYFKELKLAYESDVDKVAEEVIQNTPDEVKKK